MPPPSYDPQSLRKSSSLQRSLSGRRVLITGPSLHGVGRVIAHICSIHGAEVALADILSLDEVAAECRELGASRVVTCKFDAGLEGDSERMVKEVASQMSGQVLDNLYLNHNAGCFAPMFKQNDLLGTARRLMRINFFAYAEIADAALPFLTTAARIHHDTNGSTVPSSIVVISSLAAEMPMLDTHAYAASKAAISRWFDCMRIELRRDPELAPLINVNIIYFSAVRTDTLVRAMGGEDGPNQHVLNLAADPLDAAYATINAGIQRVPVTHFPSNIAILPKLYAIWPWCARRLVSSVVVKHTNVKI